MLKKRAGLEPSRAESVACRYGFISLRRHLWGGAQTQKRFFRASKPPVRFYLQPLSCIPEHSRSRISYITRRSTPSQKFACRKTWTLKTAVTLIPMTTTMWIRSFWTPCFRNWSRQSSQSQSSSVPTYSSKSSSSGALYFYRKCMATEPWCRQLPGKPLPPKLLQFSVEN